MHVVFCAEPFKPLSVDSSYETEEQAARAAGFEIDLIDFEALTNAQNLIYAIRKVKEQAHPVPSFYRGWMLRPEKYAQLYNALSTRNIYLINSPANYQHCHFFPESYSLIERNTPKSIFVKVDSNPNFEEIFKRLRVFDDKPLILKDYVKSRKHEWHEACFIQSAADQVTIKQVVNRFLELQGDDLNEGLVFREFVEFQKLTVHSKSQMPLIKEFRLFFLDGKLLNCFEYWDEGDYAGIYPPKNIFADVVCEIKSRFFTMDIAQRIDGEWQIIELGDAQVAGLPEKADVTKFYQILAGHLQNHESLIC